MPNFIDLKDLSRDQLLHIISLSIEWKKQGHSKFMMDKHVVLIFEKPSLRTRISFEVGINQLGGMTYLLNEKEMQLGERETIEDAARVLERYADMVVIRCFGHDQIKKFSKVSNLPVINALTDFSHPCQVVADLITIKEHFGDLKNKKIAWFGDCNNVLQSWIEASVILDFELNIGCPKGIIPDINTISWANEINKKIKINHNPLQVSEGADCVITDTWHSMGNQESISEKIFLPFQVNKNIMRQAKDNAIFMHCLPAYRDKEVSLEVLEGKQSVVFDEAENRLHAQKAIMHFCLNLN
jgi:ornithine carbamoyltransferase